MTGLEVRDAGSSLALSACTISEFPTANCEAAGVRGILILSHASAELHGLTVRDVECGIVVGMASANILNCDVSNTIESCVAFRAGATGKVENCVLSGSIQKHGLYASGGGTNVEAQNCRCCRLSVSVSGPLTDRLIERINTSPRYCAWLVHLTSTLTRKSPGLVACCCCCLCCCLTTTPCTMFWKFLC